MADETTEAESDATTEDTETDTATEETLEDTETGGTTTSETRDSTEDDTISTSTGPQKSKEQIIAAYLTPQDILGLEERHIRAEDSEWAKSPIPSLSDIIVQNIDKVKDCDLGKVLENITENQKQIILELLPINLPLTITLPLLEDGIYWQRLCLEKWPACDIWRYSDSWKSMFVHRTVQELIENFVPEHGDIFDLCENFKIFRDYVTCLDIRKILIASEKEIKIDLSSDDFDEQLDDFIASPQKQIYLDFQKVLECFEHVLELTILLSPKFINHEGFYINNADFNCLLRGLRKLKKLKKLRISNGSFTNEQITEIVKLFLKHECLVELNLSYNFIDNGVCDYIGKLLISNCPLQTLVLKYNAIADEGVKSIAAALVKNSVLKKLDLSLNMITNEGGYFLAKVLLSNRSITDLDVSKNAFTGKSGMAFATLVKESKSLRSLKIQENFLGEIAGKAFADSILTNLQVLELDVHFCGFRNEDEGTIHQAILKNRSSVPYSTCLKSSENTMGAENLF